MADWQSGSHESGFSEGSDILENFEVSRILKQRRSQRLHQYLIQHSPPETVILPRRIPSELLPYRLSPTYSESVSLRSFPFPSLYADIPNRDLPSISLPKRYASILTSKKIPKPLNKSCVCSKNVIDELQTRIGFRLLDVLDTIVDVFAFKIPFQGYPKSPIDINKWFGRASFSEGMNIEHLQMNISCPSSTHSLFVEMGIYSHENLRIEIRRAAKNKDINYIKVCLMLARENEIKGICDVLFNEKPVSMIRHTVEECLKKRFCRKYKNELRVLKMWLGNKAIVRYPITERHLNSCFDTVVILVEQDTPRVSDGLICGFHLVIVSKNDCNTEAQSLLQYESHDPTEVAMFLSENKISDLMNNHSNITMINTSRIRSCGYNTQNFQIQRTPTIVIYCQVKGVVPLGEGMFPPKINGFTVDVREGMCCLAGGKIRLSEHISAEECSKYGTLGGFIDLQPRKAFLTCAHVVLPTDVLENNTAYEYAIRREISIFNKDRMQIGTLKKAVFNHGRASGVSVDAAVVEITDTRRYPCDGNFADVFSDNQLNGAGFSRAQELHFSNGQIELISTSNVRKQVIKVGASTGITLGWLRMGRSCAQIIDDSDINIDGKLRIKLFGQLEVLPRIDPSQPSDSQQPFVSGGDSGALVFAICNENPIVLKCVGLVVAMTSYGACLMTPIDKVLDALDLPYDCFTKFSIPSSHQQTDSEDLRGLLTSITKQLTVMQSNMATKSDIQNTNENIGNLKRDLEKFNDRLTIAEEEIQSSRAAGNEFGQ